MTDRLASPRGRVALAAVAACLVVLISLAATGATDVRSGDRLSFALTGARVIAAPGRIFDPGVVVVHGGVVEAVGAEGRRLSVVVLVTKRTRILHLSAGTWAS